MTLLLDTHAILWFWWDDPRLSATALDLIRDPTNRKLVSPGSAWEVAIKVSLRKLDIGGMYLGPTSSGCRSVMTISPSSRLSRFTTKTHSIAC